MGQIGILYSKWSQVKFHQIKATNREIKVQMRRNTYKINVETPITEATSGPIEECSAGWWAEIQAEAGHEPSIVGI